MYDLSISTPDIEQSRASAQCSGEPHTAIEWHAAVGALLWRSSARAATANWHTPLWGPLAEDDCTGDALACALGWAYLDYRLGFPEVASERIFSQAFRRSPAGVLETAAWRHGRPLAT